MSVRSPVSPVQGVVLNGEKANFKVRECHFRLFAEFCPNFCLRRVIETHRCKTCCFVPFLHQRLQTLAICDNAQYFMLAKSFNDIYHYLCHLVSCMAFNSCFKTLVRELEVVLLTQSWQLIGF